MKNRLALVSWLIVFSATLALGGRLFARQSPASPPTLALTPGEMMWSTPNASGNDSTVLWGDRSHGQHATLSHYAAGFAIAPHYHTHDMRGLIVSGTWVLGIVGGSNHELPPGSYFSLPGKTAHTDLCKGPAPCMIFLMQEDARDLVALTTADKP